MVNVNGKKVSFVNNIRNKESQIITILVEDEVKDDYLAYLQSIGVSYIFEGNNNIDLQIA